MKKLICLFLFCVFAILPLYGCKKEAGSKIIKYNISKPVINLDPQFATDVYARMIIANIGEGLLVYGENGDLAPGVAESWELSADGKKITFKLREDAYWMDGAPVTADDFVFTFRRIFSPDSPSPFAEDYIAIEKAREILERKTSPQSLGVSAAGEKTLEIRLEHPSPYFPGALAETPAMPCNQEFFNESRGRYGLAKEFVASNGPLYLERWDNETSIFLRPNPKYASLDIMLGGGVNLLISDEIPVESLQNGAADIAVTSFEDAGKLEKQGYSASYFDKTVWCIGFNQSSATWGNPLLRQGLSHTIEREMLKESLPQKFTPAAALIPPDGMLAGHNYRESVRETPVAFDPVQGRHLFEMGLSALSLENLPDGIIYVPDAAEHLLAMGTLQRSWQMHLSAYINVEPATTDDIKERFLSGNYGMILLPLTLDTRGAKPMLEAFSVNSPHNGFGYRNSLYDNLLSRIPDAHSLNEAAEACARVESLLLQDAVVIPVYTEAAAFVSAPGIRGIRPTPYPSELYFKYAEK